MRPTPAEAAACGNARLTNERELFEELMQTLKRVEAAQAHAVADVRREIAQIFGQLVVALERSAELSDGGIQKLQVALGVAARERGEQRILNEITLLKADLQRPSEEEASGTERRIARPIVTLAIGITLVLAGMAAGILAAPSITPWLQSALGVF
jgi:hypothetical protein